MKTHLLASVLLLGSPLRACDSSDCPPNPTASTKPEVAVRSTKEPSPSLPSFRTYGEAASRSNEPTKSAPPPANPRPVEPAASGVRPSRPIRPAHLFM